MPPRARRFPPLLLALAAGACGGKVPGPDIATFGPDGGRTDPPPTCGAICAHLIGSCVPGASTDPCVADCESGIAGVSTSCTGERDDYLRCMIAARVECRGSDVVVIDCSDERNRLDACHP